MSERQLSCAKVCLQVHITHSPLTGRLWRQLGFEFLLTPSNEAQQLAEACNFGDHCEVTVVLVESESWALQDGHEWALHESMATFKLSAKVLQH